MYTTDKLIIMLCRAKLLVILMVNSCRWYVWFEKPGDNSCAIKIF